MQKWYCCHCGKTTYAKTKPALDYGGTCSMSIAEIQLKISTGRKEIKTPKNNRVHQWVDADIYLNEHGYLPTLNDLENEYQRRQDRNEELNDFVKEKYGNDLFLENGKLNTYYHLSPEDQPQEKSLTQEAKELADGIKKTYNKIKSFFNKS